jgi:Histidinol dehydrogenase
MPNERLILERGSWREMPAAALPTGGYARVSSGITADAFRKRTAIARATHDALERMSATVIAFARHEGFPAHEFAVTRRLTRRRSTASLIHRVRCHGSVAAVSTE